MSEDKWMLLLIYLPILVGVIVIAWAEYKNLRDGGRWGGMG